MPKCPGQDQRYWNPNDIFEVNCPNCSYSIEFCKDEPKRKCPRCTQLTWNPKIDIGCAQWCQYAAQCFGNSSPDDILCQKLIARVKDIKNLNQSQVDHLQQLIKFADEIQHGSGGNPLVIKASAILLKLQDQVLATKLLTENNLDAETIDQVVKIITNPSAAKTTQTIEHKIIMDADRLAAFNKDKNRANHPEIYNSFIDSFLTSKARRLAQEIFVKKSTS